MKINDLRNFTLAGVATAVMLGCGGGGGGRAVSAVAEGSAGTVACTGRTVAVAVGSTGATVASAVCGALHVAIKRAIKMPITGSSVF